MDPQRWARIESIYHAALAKTPDERPSFLAAVCAAEPEVRQEVESLLENADSGPVTVGKRIGSYEILGLLGAGGMGEVYRARDTRLKREVALKVVPQALANDPERMARFQREAEVLAAINHPNIAHVYGLEERAIVMELVEGETLTGPLAVDTALEYARQIAEALEYAHEKGVIHRDLKPANIKVTSEGVVKLLDFGLAKAIEDQSEAVGDPASSPTLTVGATRVGTILGTAPYMSPEQAAGKAADRRSDIWSFGAVVYEMLAGKRAFQGESISETLAGVLKVEPDWNALPSATPTTIRNLVRRCLTKDRRQRLQAIGEARIVLDDPEDLALPVRPLAPGRGRLTQVVTAVLVIALAATGAMLWRATRSREYPLLRLNLDLGSEAIPGATTSFALSPDGRRLVFLARAPDGNQQLAMRLLDEGQWNFLAGTENARDPFFSPDGQWIGFFADVYLKKVSVQGGAPVTLGRTGHLSMGASWGEDGEIVEATNPLAELMRVPASGGDPQHLTRLGSGETTHRWPQVLPGGKTVLFTAAASFSDMDNANIEAVDLRTGAVKLLQRGGYYGRFLPTGHLVYVHGGALFGVPFDPGHLEIRGSPIRLLDDLAADGSKGGQFAFSSGPSGTGMLVYLAGKPTEHRWSVSWLDRSGKLQPLISAPNTYYNPAFSPDGRRLAFDAGGANGLDIFVFDLVRENTLRLTVDGTSDRPIWTPDGAHIIYYSGSSLWSIRADGAQRPQRILNTKPTVIPGSLSPDGRELAYWEQATGDIWILPLDLSDPDHPKAGTPKPFGNSNEAGARRAAVPMHEYSPVFSPDGRWIAYTSDESGKREVYVRPASGANAKWPISNSGGGLPIWSKTGRELFYEDFDNRIMMVECTASGDSFAPGRPRVWSDKPIYSPGRMNLDIAPDGKRFAVMQALEPADSTKGGMQVVVLLNFFDELKRRIPTR